jgi:hypothetical protein
MLIKSADFALNAIGIKPKRQGICANKYKDVEQKLALNPRFS